jgi:hypothetical protein
MRKLPKPLAAKLQKNSSKGGWTYFSSFALSSKQLSPVSLSHSQGALHETFTPFFFE